MNQLIALVVFQLVITTGIIGLSAQKLTLGQAEHKLASVLGEESDTTAPADAPAPPPDNPPAETPLPTDAPPADQTAVTSETLTPTPEPPSTDTVPPEISPGPTEIQPSPTPAEAVASPEPTSTLSPVNEQISQTEAVLNPADSLNSPDNIFGQSISEVSKEDTQIAQATDPKDQTNFLVSFATDKVSDMDKAIKSDDFATTNFAAQRFNDQIDQAISNLDKVSPEARVQMKAQLTDFCNTADKTLRTVALSVPEESEQDLEMARGQCLELQL